MRLFMLIDMKKNLMQVTLEKNERRRKIKERNLKQKPQLHGMGKKGSIVATFKGNVFITLTF